MKRKIATSLLVALIVFLMILSCTGCKKSSDADNPEQALEMFIEAFRQMDLEKAKTFISKQYLEEYNDDFSEMEEVLKEGGPEAEAMKKLFTAMLNNSELKVTGHTINGDSATVNMENKLPDTDEVEELLMGKLFEHMFSDEIDFENMSEEEQMVFFADLFAESLAEVEKVEQVVQVPMLMESGAWKINGDFISDLIGDFDF